MNIQDCILHSQERLDKNKPKNYLNLHIYSNKTVNRIIIVWKNANIYINVLRTEDFLKSELQIH